MKALHITVTSAGHADGDLARFEVGGQDLGEGWTKRGINVAVIDDQGRLQHIGVSASFTAKRRAELWEELRPLVTDLEDHPWGHWAEFLTANPGRVPGTQSRWSAGKDLGFTPLRPERVLEVKYDHMEGSRFRHTAHFKRWREDRDPESCGYDQLDEPAGYDLTRILSTDSQGGER